MEELLSIADIGRESDVGYHKVLHMFRTGKTPAPFSWSHTLGGTPRPLWRRKDVAGWIEKLKALAKAEIDLDNFARFSSRTN